MGSAGRALISGKGVSVFCVDPGGTCGWAWACLGFKELRTQGVVASLQAARRYRGGLLLADSRFMVGEITDPDEGSMAERVWSQLIVCGEMGARASAGAVPEITDLVLEDFLLRERTSARNLLSPVRLNSKFEDYVRRERPDIQLHLQSPSDKSIISDERLKRWNLYFKGQQHARDAERHLVLWLRKHQTLWQ